MQNLVSFIMASPHGCARVLGFYKQSVFSAFGRPQMYDLLAFLTKAVLGSLPEPILSRPASLSMSASRLPLCLSHCWGDSCPLSCSTRQWTLHTLMTATFWRHSLSLRLGNLWFFFFFFCLQSLAFRIFVDSGILTEMSNAEQWLFFLFHSCCWNPHCPWDKDVPGCRGDICLEIEHKQEKNTDISDSITVLHHSWRRSTGGYKALFSSWYSLPSALTTTPQDLF